MRIIALVVSVMIMVLAAAAAAEPEGFVFEAVLATPGVDTPIERETAIEIEIDGYIVIISRSGQLIRKDGPHSGPAAELLDAIFASGDDDLGNPVVGASVSNDLYKSDDINGTNRTKIGFATASTDENGVATFFLKNVSQGCYDVDVTNVAADLPWSDADPENAESPVACR